jgi:hypothetical protein
MSIKWAKDILAKVDEGENVSDDDLTRAHQILTDEVLSMSVENLPRFAKNQTELATIFKVDRKTIQRWRKEPGFPKSLANGRWDVHALHVWCKANKKTNIVDEPSLHELKVRQLQLMCDKLEFELNAKKGEFSSNDDVKRWVGEMIMEAKTILLAMPSKLAPVVIGLTPAEAEVRLKDTVDEILTRLHEGS